MDQTLKLVLVGTLLVDDYDALEQGVSRKLGAVLEPTEGGRFAYRMTEEPFEVRDRAEYRRHVRRGEMLPADEATAKVLGLRFERAALAKTVSEPAPTESAKPAAKSAGKDQ